MKYVQIFLFSLIFASQLSTVAMANTEKKNEKVDCEDCSVTRSRHPSFMMVETVETASEMAEFTAELEQNLEERERQIASEESDD